jgi:hypothetical protein
MSDFSDFLKLVSEAKKTDPVAIKAKERDRAIKESVKSDFAGLLDQLASINKKVETIEHPEVKEVAEEVVEAATEQLIEEVIIEIAKPEPEASPVDKYVDAIKEAKPFAQPEVPKVSPEMKVVTDKLKFLEQWVAKISAAGPGSGEVNFRYLDDVARSTMNPDNDNWVLEYDAATKKVQFTEHVGPIRSIKMNTAGPAVALIPGQIAWNEHEDCLDIRNSDGSTLQTGLEHYIRVNNSTASPLLQGTIVSFGGGLELDGDQVPVAVPFMASTTSIPLYFIGVLTTDIQPGGVGRCTVFGKVRTLNTTGSSVGETWALGDLLWVHPTIPGKLTKNQPTAPYPAISVAAVMHVGVDDGVILVRPTVFPRLWSADWMSTVNQTLTQINTPTRITLNHEGVVSGFTNNNGLITALNTGQYNIQFSLQVVSTNSSASYYYIWYRKNGIDAEHSATKLSISSNSVVLAPSWNFPVSMQAGDTFELMWACDSLNVSLQAAPAGAFYPSVPSVILTIQQMNL